MRDIYIYGTGTIAKSVIEKGINGNIVGYIETKPIKNLFDGIKLYRLDEVEIKDNQIIIVANTYCSEIFPVLKKKCNLDNCLFWFPVYQQKDEKNNIEIAREVLSESNFANYCHNHKLYQYTFWKDDRELYAKKNHRQSFDLHTQYDYPIVTDKYDFMGNADVEFWESLWFAKHIYESRPTQHFDIGSKLKGILSYVLAMNIPLTVIDVRPFPVSIDGLKTIVDDATEMRQFEDESIESLSAISSLEHFGLGRYGDPIDPEACFKCFRNIQAKLKKGGRLYITVPVCKDRVCFNAHRVFAVSTVLNEFNQLQLKEFSYILNGVYVENADIHELDEYDGDYADGLFVFEK
jgi:predicted SAM-dependent methyltransferase/nitrate reductase NapAB chaperone NapD